MCALTLRPNQDDKRTKELEKELEWIRASPKARQVLINRPAE